MKQQQTYKEIAAKVSVEDHDVILGIIDRFERNILRVRFSPDERFKLHMDLVTVHGNACPLDLKELLASSDLDFAHDIGGIRKYLNRDTLRLSEQFRPRCSKRLVDVANQA